MKKIFLLLLLFAATHGLRAQNFALSTNILDYADFVTLNLEASYGFARHWSVNTALKYNPFSYGKGEDIMQHKQRAVSTGIRYWPWHVYSGWWLEADARYQEYNAGGILSPETSEGDRFGLGLRAGYTYMPSPSLNLDFGIALWSGYDIYTVYECPECGKVIDSGAKYFVMPADFIVALTYIF